MSDLQAALAAVKDVGYEVRRPRPRPTHEGVLTVKRYRKQERRGWPATTFYAPVGWIQYPPSDENPRWWQLRFKRLPEALHGCDGHRIRVVSTPVPFGNSLGAYATRPKVECLDEAEHVLAALAAIGTAPAKGKR